LSATDEGTSVRWHAPAHAAKRSPFDSLALAYNELVVLDEREVMRPAYATEPTAEAVVPPCAKCCPHQFISPLAAKIGHCDGSCEV